MRILALDLATTSGWATRIGTGRIEYGHFCAKPGKGDSRGSLFLAFGRWLDELIESQFRLELVAYEKPFIGPMKSGDVAAIAFGLSTRVEEYCTLKKIEYAAVLPSEIKKWATGKGNANKKLVQTCDKVVDATPGCNLTDDEADAIALLLYAEERFGRLE